MCRSGLLPSTSHSPDLSSHKDVTRKDAGPGVHFVSPGLLQLSVLRHHRSSDEPVAVCPECGCTFGVGRSTVRPHHSSYTAYRWLLASGLTSGGFQDRHPGLPVTGMATASWPPTVSWSPTKVVVSCVLPHQGRLLSNGPTATIEKVDIMHINTFVH